VKKPDFQIPHSPHDVRLADYDPGSNGGFDDKDDASTTLKSDIEKLDALQDIFAAQTQHALLIVLQGMDAAGKDGIVKHVMSGVNPSGVNVYSFRKPTEEEERHDYLWRESKRLPERGRIAIFNRSYYEEVLVVRVLPQLLRDEGQAGESSKCWEHRYEDINAFERHLTRCGTIVLKFFMHVSKEEQRSRLLKRLETPAKMYKASDADLAGHAAWDAYVKAYEEMLSATSTPWAPWYAIPADKKWVARAAVGGIIVETLEALDLKYPEPSAGRRKLYASLAEQLHAEKD